MRKEPGSDTNSSAGLSPVVPWHVVDVRPAGRYCLFVTFTDGTRGEVDLSRLVASEDAGVFEQLRDPAMFARAGVVHGAVTWPNGVDLAPDAMYDEIKAASRWVP
jgi:hypothetical protein